jgi:hypothetical protein
VVNFIRGQLGSHRANIDYRDQLDRGLEAAGKGLDVR